MKDRPTLLVMAFRHQQQSDINTLMCRIDELQTTAPDFNALQLPVLRRA
jgi:hypothetical protein